MKGSKTKAKQRPKKAPDQPLIGTYRLGLTNVELYGLTNEYGGQFFNAPDKTSLPRVKIGLRYEYWWEIVAIVLHETFEYLTAQRDVRLVPCGTCMRASDIYQFHFDHKQFSQIAEDQGYFLAKALPDLCTTWKQYKPKT